MTEADILMFLGIALWERILYTNRSVTALHNNGAAYKAIAAPSFASQRDRTRTIEKTLDKAPNMLQPSHQDRYIASRES